VPGRGRGGNGAVVAGRRGGGTAERLGWRGVGTGPAQSGVNERWLHGAGSRERGGGSYGCAAQLLLSENVCWASSTARSGSFSSRPAPASTYEIFFQLVRSSASHAHHLEPRKKTTRTSRYVRAVLFINTCFATDASAPPWVPWPTVDDQHSSNSQHTAWGPVTVPMGTA